MCELLGISADHPIAFSCSLASLAGHGRLRGDNHDGWGLAAYEGRGARLIKEPEPAGDSAWVRFIEEHGVASPLVIAHIRHATAGGLRYVDTHPFQRELGGRQHVFAHNGTLKRPNELLPSGSAYRPIGDTDSELAFCALLERLRACWSRARAPSISARHAVLATFARDLAERGPANFLYSDGELLIAHGHRRRWDDGRTRPPGLHFIQRSRLPADRTWLASGIDLGPAPQPVAIFASVPLTEEKWWPLQEGEMLVLCRGRLVTG